MDMSSKMDGTAPVSSALEGVWEIRKKDRIDDQRNEKKKRDLEKKGEEEFEDGLIPREDDPITFEGREDEEARTDADGSTDENPTETRKIDIII